MSTPEYNRRDYLNSLSEIDKLRADLEQAKKENTRLQGIINDWHTSALPILGSDCRPARLADRNSTLVTMASAAAKYLIDLDAKQSQNSLMRNTLEWIVGYRNSTTTGQVPTAESHIQSLLTDKERIISKAETCLHALKEIP